VSTGMDLYEAMRSAPTTRRFASRPVPTEVLRRVLDNARFAPSGGNRQGWRVIAVSDAASRRALRDLYQPHWRAYMELTGGAAMLSDPGSAEPGRLKMLKRANEFAEQVHEVPLHLVVCAKLGDLAIVDAGLDRPSIVGGASVYPMAQNFCLALRDQDVATTFTTLLVAREPEVKELLGIPAEFSTACHIVAGYPAEGFPTKLRRLPVEQLAFVERFGRPLEL